ncbi:lytic transglycosylase domain-containing protein [Microbacterium trichothecenolyticum]|nr:lytic transglycosylase domain-containing protein [Microbacterium trichothecenolyticum]
MSAVLVASAGVAAWFLLGALSVTPDPEGYLVAPPADAAAAVAETSDPDGRGNAGSPVASVVHGNVDLVDPAWAKRTAVATGIPLRALSAYAGAELALAAETPQCGVRWSTLAALGSIESSHGTHAGSAIGDDGVARPGIFGVDLTGESSARIGDTDGGVWDGKPDIDRAVGPMQFIPATWETWGADGNRDGARDPQQIDDAALAAARYLCHHGDLSTADAWRTAVFAYNHLESYVDAVAATANEYAGRAAR